MKHKDKPRIYTKSREEIGLSAEGFKQLMTAVLEKGFSFRFMAKGTSMFPFIRHGDIITVFPKNTRTLKKGEVVVFFNPRCKGISAHRVLKKKHGAYLIKGDNMFRPDGLIREENISGIVDKIERNGKKILFGTGPEKYLLSHLSRTNFFPALIKFLRRDPQENKIRKR